MSEMTPTTSLPLEPGRGISERVLAPWMIANGWTIWHFVGALVLAALGIVVTRDVWADIAYIAWTHEESSHVLLVAVAAPWIVLARAHHFRRCRPRSLWIGPVLVLIGSVSMIYGYDNHHISSLWRGGALTVVVGCLLTFLGRDVLIRFFPAFAVLIFLLPMPPIVQMWIAMPLQTVMAAGAEHLALMMGFSLERSGNLLVVGGQHIEIAEACNGMRMVFALFLVSFTFAFVMPLRWYVRVVVLVSAPLIALAGNGVRLVPTVLVYAYGTEAAGDQFHDFAGWAMVPVTVGLIFLAVWLLEWLDVPVWQKRRHRSTDEEDGKRRWTLRAPDNPMRSVTWAALAAVAVLVGLADHVQARQMPDDAVAHHQNVALAAAALPQVVDGQWLGRDQEVPRYARELLQPNVLVNRRYVNLRSDRSVQFLLVQTLDARSMVNHWPPVCYRYSGWDRKWTQTRQWTAAGQDLPVTEYQFVGGPLEGGREMIVSNMMVLPNGELAPDMAPVDAVANQPMQRSYGAGQIQMIFDYDVPEEERRAIFETFIEGHRDLIERMLRRLDDH